MARQKTRKTYGVLVSYRYISIKNTLATDSIADKLSKNGRLIGTGCDLYSKERDLHYEFRSRVGAMRAIEEFKKDRRFKILTKEPETLT